MGGPFISFIFFLFSYGLHFHSQKQGIEEYLLDTVSQWASDASHIFAIASVHEEKFWKTQGYHRASPTSAEHGNVEAFVNACGIQLSPDTFVMVFLRNA